MKKSLFNLIFTLLAGSFLFTSCTKNDNPPQPPLASVTLINMHAAASKIGFAIDGKLANPALDYKTYSSILAYTGQRKLSIMDVESKDTLLDSVVSLSENKSYSALAFSLQDSTHLLFTQDNSITLEEQSGIRFLNVADSELSVSLFIGDDTEAIVENRPTETDTTVTEHQKFVAQEAGTYTLVVKDAEGNTLATREDITLKSKNYYSLILSGDPTQEETPLYLGIVTH